MKSDVTDILLKRTRTKYRPGELYHTGVKRRKRVGSILKAQLSAPPKPPTPNQAQNPVTKIDSKSQVGPNPHSQSHSIGSSILFYIIFFITFYIPIFCIFLQYFLKTFSIFFLTIFFSRHLSVFYYIFHFFYSFTLQPFI